MEDRILIVDDEKMTYSVVARRLAKEGYACVMANNGREALGYFYKDNFSLIISDIRMPEHPLIGVKIVEGIEFFKDKISMIPNHHEHFDGGGYPDGLVGEAIPIEARIIAVPDAFDAITSLRPHREAMPLEDVLVEMGKGKGQTIRSQNLGDLSE